MYRRLSQAPVKKRVGKKVFGNIVAVGGVPTRIIANVDDERTRFQISG